MRGDLTPAAYHDLIVGLGLLPLAAQLAELCPDAGRREGLLAAHRGFLESAAAHDAAALGAGWVPPEAALAAVARAEKRMAWSCGVCTLVNAPGSRACEVCGTPWAAAVAAAQRGQQQHHAQEQEQRQQQQQQPQAAWSASPAGVASPARPTAASLFSGSGGAAGGSGGTWGRAAQPASDASQQQPQPPQQQPPLPPAAAEGAWPSLGGSGRAYSPAAARPGPSSRADVEAEEADPEPTEAGGGKGKKKKSQKQPLQQLLQSGRTAPGNAWSQPQRTAKLGAAPAVAQPKGAWGAKAGGGEKLSRQLRATGLGEQ